MSKVILPKTYDAKYGIMDTEILIKVTKDFFERELAEALNLTRISAPLFVNKTSGLNDNLNGVERPVAFKKRWSRVWSRNIYRYECDKKR